MLFGALLALTMLGKGMALELAETIRADPVTRTWQRRRRFIRHHPNGPVRMITG